MSKRPLCGGTILFCCGILAASMRTWYAYLICAAVLCLILFSFLCAPLKRAFEAERHVPKEAYLISLLFPVFFFFGFFLYCHADENSRWYEAYDFDGVTVTVTGTVYDMASESDMQSIYLTDVTMTCDGQTYQTNRILLRTWFEDAAGEITLYDEIRIGNRIQAQGEISVFTNARNPGNFDALAYYRTKGIDFRMEPVSVSIEDEGVSWCMDFLYRLKEKLWLVFRSCLSEDAYGVLGTMVLGDDAALSQETETLYQEAGISHILAISGLHVSIVGMLAYRKLRKMGISYLCCSIPTVLLVTGFALMSGMGIAVQRAVIMFAVMIVGNLFGYAYDSLSALALAALVILGVNPLLLFSASFQLSFCAVLGASLVFPVLKRFLNGTHAIFESFALSFSIQLVTVPVTLYYYYEIPVFSLAANLIMVPFVSVLLLLGLAGGAAGLIFLPAARIILLPAEWILRGYTFVCTLIRNIPGHMLICGRPSVGKMVMYYGLLSAALCLMHRSGRRNRGQITDENPPEAGKPRRKREKNASVGRIPKMKRHGNPAGCRMAHSAWDTARKRVGMGILTLFLLLLMMLRMPEKFRITMLDVGQGDGILVECSGIYVFIDGGSSDVTDVGIWRIEPYLKYNGIRKIDLWLVSHTDSDHTSGLIDLLESGYEIDYLAFAAGVYEDEELTELTRTAQENGTQVLYLEQGSTLTQGDAVWTLLYPADDNTYTDKNDASMVLLLQYGDFTALFTGDITSETEEDLLEDGCLTRYLSVSDRVNGIDLLKAAHHGSKYSSSEAFLEAVSPNAAIISAGVDNLYGHPSTETLIRLSAYTDEIYVTAEEGAIFVTYEEGEVIIETYLGKE